MPLPLATAMPYGATLHGWPLELHLPGEQLDLVPGHRLVEPADLRPATGEVGVRLGLLGEAVHGDVRLAGLGAVVGVTGDRGAVRASCP